MERDNVVWDIASTYAVQGVMRPHLTRDYSIRMLDVHRLRKPGDGGQHSVRA